MSDPTDAGEGTGWPWTRMVVGDAGFTDVSVTAAPSDRSSLVYVSRRP